MRVEAGGLEWEVIGLAGKEAEAGGSGRPCYPRPIEMGELIVELESDNPTKDRRHQRLAISGQR